MKRLRRASMQDVPDLASLHAECFTPAWDASAFESFLSSAGVFALLAQEDGKPVGFVLVRVAAGEGEILSIGVRHESRSQGLGSHLLAAAAEGVTELGATELFLEVGDGNVAARALYRALGFGQVGARPGYYPGASGVGKDALILRAILPLADSGMGKSGELD
jgi:ribosomal-protein-alanine N-acetyltransferase